MTNSLLKKSFQLIGILFYSFILFQPVLAIAQDAQVNTFKHTIRWLNESNFPNYFQIPGIRDSVNSNIKQDLKRQFMVQNVTFPDKVEYRIITGFGNPKNIPSFNKMKLSKNKRMVAGAESNFGRPSLKNESTNEWYPFFIKERATAEEVVISLEILVCLFFGVGNM